MKTELSALGLQEPFTSPVEGSTTARLEAGTGTALPIWLNPPAIYKLLPENNRSSTSPLEKGFQVVRVPLVVASKTEARFRRDCKPLPPPSALLKLPPT